MESNKKNENYIQENTRGVFKSNFELSKENVSKLFYELKRIRDLAF